MGFKSNRREIDANQKLAFRRANEDVVGQADENAPVRDGHLHASITWKMLLDGSNEMKSRFGSALRYAAIRELGGVIYPVRAKRLVWRDYEGRFHASKKVVQAPGGRRGSPKHGKPYLKPAGEKFGEFMDKHLKQLG
jgi:hypothetical protein